MWEESKREVEEATENQFENMNRDARVDHHRLEERDDMNQEIKFLKDKIKNLKYREEDMEDEIGDLEYKNENLEKGLHNLQKELSDVHKALEEKTKIENELEEHKRTSDTPIKQLHKENEALGQKMKSLHERPNMQISEKEVDNKNHSGAKESHLTEEVEELLREIEQLRGKNEEKKDLIVKLSEEKEIALEKLQLKKETLKKTLVSKSLHEELCMSLEENIFSKFKYNSCEKLFGNRYA